ncbi:MAG: ATP-grasp domain-containing protein [Acidobacteria bacterium]|nr:ATP-grasp domain-containing protein [Acidobacteriota bacterium]
MSRELVVVTSSRWLADDLASAGTVPVRHTLGLDIPDMGPGTALWCSGAWAGRLIASRFDHPFLAAGATWMTRVPEQFLRRRLVAGHLGDGQDVAGPVFAKLAEHKHSSIPAKVYPNFSDFEKLVIESFGKTASLGVNWVASEPVSFVREYRCFVADRAVTAASFYVASFYVDSRSAGSVTWDAYTSETSPNTGVASAFAQQVLDAMGDDQPPGFTLDVGQLADGSWAVVEANAAWSSNIYHGDPAGVIESILASQHHDADARWSWTPDETFQLKARPLERRQP